MKRNATLFQAFEEAAHRFPEGAALKFRGRTIRYVELLEQTERLVGALSAKGVRRGSVVTLCLPNLPEAVAALYAVNRLGAVAHLVHPLTPARQLGEFLDETGSGLVFLLPAQAKAYRTVLRGRKIPAVLCSPAGSLGAAARAFYALTHLGDLPGRGDWTRFPVLMKGPKIAIPPDWGSPEDTAVLLHSGGTSGSPKTIEISSRAINALCSNSAYILGREDVETLTMHAVLPMFHGFGLCMGIHAMLAHGGCDLLMPKFDARETADLVCRGELSVLIGVPALFEALLAEPAFRGDGLKNLTAAFVGGDFVPRGLVNRFDARMEQAGAGARLFEGYGLTEVVTVCAVNTGAFHRPGTVGRPLPDMKIRIAGPDGVELPRGTPGEILVSGDERMNGYLRDPETTERVLFDKDGRTWVRTADFGSMDEAGFVTFLSRVKRIVKVSGVSVFPSEIEQIAVEVPGVLSACAMGVPDARHGSVIALFVETSASGLEHEIRKRIAERLPVYALPGRIFALEQMPRTPVGKADAGRLMEFYGQCEKK